MNYLQRLLTLIAISFAVFSCQKEYSVENHPGGGNASAQWSFSEGSAQFKGPIDTVSVDTLGNSKILTINGHSSDNKEEIALEIFGTDLKVGTYKTPYCLFAYMRSGILIYQTNQTAVDSFTINITKLDSTGITGTFNGKAYDTAKVGKTIVEGKFSAVFKTSKPPAPASADSGQVVLWSKAGCGGGTSTSPISVSVGTKTGQITQFFATEPTTCDPAGTFSIKLPVGTYPLVAKCGADSIKGTVTVTKNTCTKVQVDLTAPQTTGDYFPMTTASNWSYLYEGGTPADTLYTLSTGNTKVLGSQTYYLFTNNDGLSRDTSYYRKSGNTYYEHIAASTTKDSTTGLTISLPAFEYKFLVDNLAANATFANGPFPGTALVSGNPVPFSASNKTTVLDTGASVTIGTLPPYTHVIKVKTIYSYTVAGTTTDIYGVEQWFAKGVGLIKYIDYKTSPFRTPTYIKNITRARVY
ncbi:MAG: hypothetical protein NVSMB7_05410 [Chitinophagaceae bacterium]